MANIENNELLKQFIKRRQKECCKNEKYFRPNL